MTYAHSPLADFAARWPGWSIRPGRTGGLAARINPAARVALIDPMRWLRDPDRAVAHVLAVLDLGLHTAGRALTREESAMASELAQIRLDGTVARTFVQASPTADTIPRGEFTAAPQP